MQQRESLAVADGMTAVTGQKKYWLDWKGRLAGKMNVSLDKLQGLAQVRFLSSMHMGLTTGGLKQRDFFSPF